MKLSKPDEDPDREPPQLPESDTSDREPTVRLHEGAESMPVSEAVEFTFDQMCSDLNHLGAGQRELEERVEELEAEVDELEAWIQTLIQGQYNIIEELGGDQSDHQDWLNRIQEQFGGG